MMFGRRALISGTAAIGGTILCPAALTAQGAVRSGTSLTALQKFVRMRSSQAGRHTFWWYSGQLLGRVGEAGLRPLFSIAGVSRTIGQWQGDGSFRYDMVEAGYYGDPDTGEIVDGQIVNPLTGELVRPQHYLSPQKLTFTPELTVRPDRAVTPDTGAFSGTITSPDEKGDRIWMAERLTGQLFGSADQPGKFFNSLANFEASLSDVVSASGFVPATMQYTTLNSFRPWMNMKNARGNISSRLNAIKLDCWEGIPEQLRSRVAADHPGEFTNA